MRMNQRRGVRVHAHESTAVRAHHLRSRTPRSIAVGVSMEEAA